MTDRHHVSKPNPSKPGSHRLIPKDVKPGFKIDEDCLVVLDSSALLASYIQGPKVLESAGYIFQELVRQGRLIIPKAAFREFSRQRERMLVELSKKFESKIIELPYFKGESNSLLEDLDSYQEVDRLEAEIDSLLRMRNDSVQRVLEHIHEWIEAVPINSFYTELFSSKVIPDPPFEQEHIKEEYSRRKLQQIPPVHQRTEEDEGFEELLIWFTILELGRERRKNILLVSEQKKGAWSYEGEGESLAPWTELDKEFRVSSGGRSFYAASFSEFVGILGKKRVDSPEKVTEGVSVIDQQEVRMLELVRRGFTNQEIGRKLRVSTNTVKNYLIRVYLKLNVRNRAGAVQKAIQLGLLEASKPDMESIAKIHWDMMPLDVEKYYRISPHEKKALQLAQKGLEYREIAEQLVRSEGTVRNYFLDIYRKLGVRNKAEAIQKAIGLGLLGAPGTALGSTTDIHQPTKPIDVDPVHRISPREKEILQLAQRGLRLHEIAAELKVSVSTVRIHLMKIYGKLGVSNKAEAVQKVIEIGLCTEKN